MKKTEILAIVKTSVNAKLKAVGLADDHHFHTMPWDDAMIKASEHFERTGDPKYEMMTLIYLHGGRMVDNIEKSHFVFD